MSSIFVPELAIIESRKKYPAKFEKAVTNLGKSTKGKTNVKENLRSDDAVISHIANREEEIWTVWANLCQASRSQA